MQSSQLSQNNSRRNPIINHWICKINRNQVNQQWLRTHPWMTRPIFRTWMPILLVITIVWIKDRVCAFITRNVRLSVKKYREASYLKTRRKKSCNLKIKKNSRIYKKFKVKNPYKIQQLMKVRSLSNWKCC